MSREHIYNVLIPEPIPSLNKGEAAILIGILNSFDTQGSFRTMVFSDNAELDKNRYKPYGVKVVEADEIALMYSLPGLVGGKIRYLSSFAMLTFKHLIFGVLYRVLKQNATIILRGPVWKSYANADIILFGHDSAFHPLYHTVVTQLCKYLGKPCALYGGSLRETRRRLVGRLVKKCIKNTELVILRENTSFQHLMSIGIDTSLIHVKTDLAFLLPPASDKRVLEIIRHEHIEIDNTSILGMTVSRRMCSRAFPEMPAASDRYQAYIRIHAQVVDYIVEKLNVTVVFITHSFGPERENDDRLAASDIMKLVKSGNRIKVIENEYSPEETKGIIGKCDFFVGQRLHSVIDALSMHVPSIMISYPKDFRSQGIFADNLRQKAWLYNIEQADFQTLSSIIERGWQSRQNTKEKAISIVESQKELALESGQLLRRKLMDSDGAIF